MLYTRAHFFVDCATELRPIPVSVLVLLSVRPSPTPPIAGPLPSVGRRRRPRPMGSGTRFSLGRRRRRDVDFPTEGNCIVHSLTALCLWAALREALFGSRCRQAHCFKLHCLGCRLMMMAVLFALGPSKIIALLPMPGFDFRGFLNPQGGGVKVVSALHRNRDH